MKIKYETIARVVLGMLFSLTLTLLILFCMFFSGCSKKVYVPVESVRTEYVQADTTGLYSRIASMFERYREKEVKVDSFVDRSKELLVLNENGDTTKHFRYRYIHLSEKERTELESMIAQKDSTINELETKLKAVKTDSVPVPYPVEKELSKWQQAKMNVGGIVIWLASAVALGFVIVWLIKKFKK